MRFSLSRPTPRNASANPMREGTARWVGPKKISKKYTISGCGIYQEYRDTLEVQPWAFLRMLAKIAHSFAVAELGWQRFCEYRPLLKSIILDTSDFSTHYIGCVAESVGDPKILHWLSGNVVRMDGRELFIVDISLFSFLNRTPVYRVVVAEKNITPEAESK